MEIINTDFENWGAYLMKQFQTMYEKGERCDLEISCNKQIFLVHRLIMSACSDYVRELGDKQHIILPEEVSCKTLKTVIDFVYCGKIVFHKEDKDDLLIAAGLLNMRLLMELIKREDPSSYTISMDDDNEEKGDGELINNGTAENFKVAVNSDSVEREAINSGQVATKRKSETKYNRSKSSKNCVVLPPLHRFPYLQHKFSASRTYGLITTLTSPMPSRFEISDAELMNSAYRSTFEDVTYETPKLFQNADILVPLEATHYQFLQKLRDTPGHRRSYSNALYSPFDKYTPPCNLKTESVSTRRPESVVSYPSKTNSTTTVRKYQVHYVVESKEVNSHSHSLPFPSPKEYKKPENSKNITRNLPHTHVEKHVRFSDDVDVREIGVEFSESLTNDLEKLPEPIMPSEIMQETMTREDDKLELIKLNNVQPDFVEKDQLSYTGLEEASNVSISVVHIGNNQTDPINLPQTVASECMEVDNVEGLYELQPSDSTVANYGLEMLAPRDSILPNEEAKHSYITDNETPVEVSLPKSIPSSTIEDISTDASLFTSLTVNSGSDVTTDLNSKIFAMKVEESESPTQLNQLVDLCKNNPLFKNKNIRFKIVPVKGTIREKLVDAPLVGNAINKAIIVKRTENHLPTNPTTLFETPKAVTSLKKPLTESVKCISDHETNKVKSRVHPIENTSGPWTCSSCNVSKETIHFDTYLEYRMHLHSTHNEPNNPIYCIHCGHKALKRNMQLYHLFVKHNVPPPSHIKFPKCDKCEFHALNEYYLQKHLICHPSEGMEYVCSCKVAFRSSELLQKHMVSGDCKNSKSFTCGYCRCVFDRFVNLKAHMRVCMKERSKPMLENNSERSVSIKTISDGGKDYLAL